MHDGADCHARCAVQGLVAARLQFFQGSATVATADFRQRGGDDSDSDADENDPVGEFVDDLHLALNGLVAGGDAEMEVASDDSASEAASEGGEEEDEEDAAPLFDAEAARGASKYTVKQGAFALGKVFHDGQVHYKTGEEILRIIHAMMPEGNKVPRCDCGDLAANCFDAGAMLAW